MGADLVRPRLRLVRLAPGRRCAPDPGSKGAGSLRFAIDVLESGPFSLKDSENRTIVTTSSSILTGGWVRIEWMVNQPAGSVTILLFNSPNDTDPTETLLSPDGVSIGPDTDQVQNGHPGRSAARPSLDRQPGHRHGGIPGSGPLIRGAESRPKTLAGIPRRTVCIGTRPM